MIGLVDNGYFERVFIDYMLVKILNIIINPTPRSRTLILINGKIVNMITKYFVVKVIMGFYKELYLFFIINLSKDISLIFRFL